MALEPGGRRDQLVTGSSNGELKFVDLRKLGGEADPRGGNMGVWQRVEAHSKGSVTALAAHPNAPSWLPAPTPRLNLFFLFS